MNIKVAAYVMAYLLCNTTMIQKVYYFYSINNNKCNNIETKTTKQ